jgi:hypothetical protein
MNSNKQVQQNYAYAEVEVTAVAMKYFHSGELVAYYDFNNVTSLRCLKGV